MDSLPTEVISKILNYLDSFRLNNIIENAIETNDLLLLQRLHNNNKLTVVASYIACLHNKFKILKWLHEIGAPFDEWTCVRATQKDNLAFLKYLHENGCE